MTETVFASPFSVHIRSYYWHLLRSYYWVITGTSEQSLSLVTLLCGKHTGKGLNLKQEKQYSLSPYECESLPKPSNSTCRLQQEIYKSAMCETHTAPDQRMTLTNGIMQQKDLDFESTFAFGIHVIYLLYICIICRTTALWFGKCKQWLIKKITESREGRRRCLYLGLILHGIATYSCGAITANFY